MMMQILYSIAKGADGLMHHIDEEPQPCHIPYGCGDCGHEMVARRGGVRRHHFAHKSESSCTPRPDPDNALHKFAVKNLVEGLGRGGYRLGTICERCKEEFDVPFFDGEVAQEFQAVKGTRADIAIINRHDDPDSKPLLIEVVNTHEPERETRQRYENVGLTVLLVRADYDTLDDLKERAVAYDLINGGRRRPSGVRRRLIWCDECRRGRSRRRRSASRRKSNSLRMRRHHLK